MKFKIFTGLGHDDIKKVEAEINDWLSLGPIEVRDSQTSLCQVADSSDGERYQCLVVTVWYD